MRLWQPEVLCSGCSARATAQDYRNYGKLRKKEARQALRILGMKKQDVVFFELSRPWAAQSSAEALDRQAALFSFSFSASPDFSPVRKNKAALYGIKAVSPNSYAKGEARPYGNTVYNRTNGISATGASWSGGKI